MKRTWNVRVGLTALLAAGVLALGVAGAQAQGGGGFQMTPEMQAKIKAWQKYRDEHKKLSNLQTLLFQLRQMEKQSPESALNKDQSGKMLAILTTWRKKPSMSEDEAGDVSKKITALLTDKQLNKMSTYKMNFGGGGRPGGGGPGGGARPGGGAPGGGGARPGGGPGGPGGGSFTFPDPPKGGYNPLNPDTLPFERMRPEAKKSMDEFTTSLQKRSKG